MENSKKFHLKGEPAQSSINESAGLESSLQPNFGEQFDENGRRLINAARLRVEINTGLQNRMKLEDLMRAFYLLVLEESLADCDGNQRKAAKQLGLHRNSLARRIKALGIKLDKFYPPGFNSRGNRRKKR